MQSTCLARCPSWKHTVMKPLTFSSKLYRHVTFFFFFPLSRLIHPSHASPGAGRKGAATLAELSSSQTSRLIQNERRLNPLLKIWRGTDAHAAEALLWPAAREARVVTFVTFGRTSDGAQLNRIWKTIKKTFFFFFLPFFRCNTSLNSVKLLDSSLFNPRPAKSRKSRRLSFSGCGGVNWNYTPLSCESSQTENNYFTLRELW